MKSWYLVAYDVRDGKRLRKTAKILEGYGTRIQYSLFRCFMSRKMLEHLRWDLSKILTKDPYIGRYDIVFAFMRQMRQ
jgi:CRISPR-associated protein Cas2